MAQGSLGGRSVGIEQRAAQAGCPGPAACSETSAWPVTPGAQPGTTRSSTGTAAAAPGAPRRVSTSLTWHPRQTLPPAPSGAASAASGTIKSRRARMTGGGSRGSTSIRRPGCMKPRTTTTAPATPTPRRSAASWASPGPPCTPMSRNCLHQELPGNSDDAGAAGHQTSGYRAAPVIRGTDPRSRQRVWLKTVCDTM